MGRVPATWTSVRPAHDVIVALMEKGITQREISRVSGVTEDTLRTYRKNPDGRTLRTDIVDAIVGLMDPVHLKRFQRQEQPSLIGAQRRLRGLVRMGHSLAKLRAELGFDPQGITVAGRRASLSWDEYDKIVELYDRWSMVVGEKNVIAKAVSLGYLPPLAWDDDEIDNPSALPSGVVEGQVRNVLPSGREFHSLAKRRSTAEIARIYGVSRSRVRRKKVEETLAS